MRNVKTARGRSLDMGALAKKNEESIAVGNIRMNARGDRIGKDGKVKKTVQAVAQEQAIATEAPEIMAMSDVGREPEPIQAPPPSEQPAPENVPIVSREVKFREDGSSYEEIEYADGSMETVEMGNPDEF